MIDKYQFNMFQVSAPSPSSPTPTATSGATATAAAIKPASIDTSKWSGGPSTFKDGPVSNIRAVIAKRLGESKVIFKYNYKI